MSIYPSGMKIPGRARCYCFYNKYIHSAKTGKFNREQYRIAQWRVLRHNVVGLIPRILAARERLLPVSSNTALM